MIKAILFDLDDTLGDRRNSIKNYATKFINKYCNKLSDKEHENRVELFVELDKRGYSNKYDMYNKLIDEWRLDGNLTSKLLVDEWLDEFYKSYVLFESAEKLLKNLKLKYKLGLLTNGSSKSQRNKIKAAKIEKYFDAIIVSGEIGISKPDVDGYLMLCNQLNVLPEECIYVGDKIETDIKGAINTNMPAVWINDEFKGDIRKEEYGFQINNISMLKKILDKYIS